LSPSRALEVLRRAPARHFSRLILPVLGMPVRFESNSAAVLQVAEETFGGWRVLEGHPRWITPGGVRVRIRVLPGGEGGGLTPVNHGVPRRQLLLLNSGGCHGYADAQLGVGVAEVSEALLAHPEHFRHGVLEAQTLFMAARRDRDPLHAAALVRGEHALLLAGPSGVGKSTLVYAAMRAGMRVLSEDGVFLQRQPRRVWALPRKVHLKPDAPRFFPELEGLAPRLLANGKWKLALPLPAESAAPWPAVERAGICLLRRGEAVGVERLGADEVVRALTSRVEGGFDLYTDSVGERIRALAEHGAWRLTLGPSLEQAVERVSGLLDELVQRGR
jgi:hypothetical protein